jgi:hypothetical protein
LGSYCNVDAYAGLHAYRFDSGKSGCAGGYKLAQLEQLGQLGHQRVGVDQYFNDRLVDSVDDGRDSQLGTSCWWSGDCSGGGFNDGEEMRIGIGQLGNDGTTFTYIPNIYDLTQTDPLPGAVPGCFNNLTGQYESDTSLCSQPSAASVIQLPSPAMVQLPTAPQFSTTAQPGTPGIIAPNPAQPPPPWSLSPALPIQMAPETELTPVNIVSPLPNLTAAIAPYSGGQPSLWCEVNTWIEQNPLLAGLAVVGLTMLLWRKK